MNPKKTRIYVIIILFCIIATVTVFVIGNRTTPVQPAPVSLSLQPAATEGNLTLKSLPDGSFPPPAVFPSNHKFDSTILDSSLFKTLQPYTPPQIDKSELGRDDPFNKY